VFWFQAELKFQIIFFTMIRSIACVEILIFSKTDTHPVCRFCLQKPDLKHDQVMWGAAAPVFYVSFTENRICEGTYATLYFPKEFTYLFYFSVPSSFYFSLHRPVAGPNYPPLEWVSGTGFFTKYKAIVDWNWFLLHITNAAFKNAWNIQPLRPYASWRGS
jgi:hypothetical protein